MNNSTATGTTEKKIFRWTSALAEETDSIAVEEPLEIILVYETDSGRMERSVAVTMRTPGNDEELALGFLYTEKIIQSDKQVIKTELNAKDVNRVRVFLEKGFIPDIKKIQRNFYMSSSCGVCGRSSIDAVIQELSPIPSRAFNISARILQQLSDKVENAQSNFQRTGGIHAAALFNLDGELLMLKEDVGRHNAMDKLSGAMLNAGVSSEYKILFLSGRASFELMQKAAIMKIPIVVSVGAPSTLAIEIAEEQNILLAGFLRKERFNVYYHQKDIHNFIK